MSPDLQDQKLDLLRQLAELEDRIAQRECNAKIEEAWQHMAEARKLIQEADKLDAAQKREQDEQKRLQRQEKKARLETQLVAAEAEYRGCVHDALAFVVTTSNRALKPDEQAFYDAPETAPVNLSDGVYRQFSEYHAGRIAQARHTLGDLRRELAAV